MEDSFCDCHRKPELYVLIKVMSLKETSLESIHSRCQHVSGGGEGGSPCADGPKFTVHRKQKSLS